MEKEIERLKKLIKELTQEIHQLKNNAMSESEKQKEIKKLQAIIDKQIAFTHIIKLFTK